MHGIMLWPLGGLAFVQPPQRPGPFLWSIAAGPLVNVVLLPITFVAWIAGKGGQSILRDGSSFEYAVGVGEASNPKLEPLAALGAPKIDPQSLDAARVTALMMSAGLL